MPSTPFVDQNPVFAPLKTTGARYVLPFGGAGSGKSVFTAQHMIEKCGRNSGHFILLVRKVKTDVRDSQYAQITKILDKTGLERRVKTRRQEMRITFPNGAEMKAFGMDDPERLKSVTDPSVVWVEEANQLNEEDFTQLDLRLRGKRGVDFQVWLTFNPNIGKAHWLRRKFFNDKTAMAPQNTEVLRTTWRHNAFADEEYGRVLENLPEGEQKVYDLGLFNDTADPDQPIRDEWVDAAFERDPETVRNRIENAESRKAEALRGRLMGGDVARFGNDLSSLALLSSGVLGRIESAEWSRTTTTTQRILEWMEETGILGKQIAVDTVGLGAGVADELHNGDVIIREFKAGAGAVEDKISDDTFFNFSNIRSQAWWWLRTLLREGWVCFDVDPNSVEAQRLRQDLTSPRYRVKGDRELEVEPKQGNQNWGLRERLGRSTDEGDAVVQAAFVKRLPDPDPLDYGRI